MDGTYLFLADEGYKTKYSLRDVRVIVQINYPSVSLSFLNYNQAPLYGTMVSDTEGWIDMWPLPSVYAGYNPETCVTKTIYGNIEYSLIKEDCFYELLCCRSVQRDICM